MSEYQYYEFQAIDRFLTDDEFAVVKKLSSRGNVSRNKAIFVYNYSDFRYEPVKILTDYFDMMLYLANWGTRRLGFRLPKDLVNIEELARYCVPEVITMSVMDDYVIIDIHFNSEEGSGWVEGDEILSELLTLRDDLLQGNYQALYLAWLGTLTQEMADDIDDNQFEPPVPSGLKKLSVHLKQFIDFFEIDPNLIKVAVTESDETRNPTLVTTECLSRLTTVERDEFLLRLLNGEANIDRKLKKRLCELQNDHKSSIKNILQNGQRTIGQLLAAAEQLTIEKETEKQRAKAAARIAKLNLLAQQESQIWSEVFKKINTKTSKGYEQAVKLLSDLKDLANHLGTTEQFIAKVTKIQQDYSRYSSLKDHMMRQNII